MPTHPRLFTLTVAGETPSMYNARMPKLDLPKLRTAILFLALSALTLSACGGRRLGTSWPNMTASGDMLYLAGGAAVYAISPDSGTLQWRFPVEGNRDASQFYAAPTLADDLVIVSSFNQSAFALDKQGAQQWTFDGEPIRSDTAPSATSAADGLAYLVAGNFLHALHMDSGAEAWTFEADNALWAAPAADGERLYQPSMNHVLYALDPASGAEVWQAEFDGALAATPSVVDGTLFLGSLSNHAYAVEAATGQTRWKIETSGWVWSSPVVVDGIAYLGDLQGTVYAVEADSGQTVWTATLDSAVRGAPAVANGSVFVNTEQGFAYALEADSGATSWEVELDPNTAERLLATPLAVDDLLVITAMSGAHLVSAYEQQTGTLAWQFDPDR